MFEIYIDYYLGMYSGNVLQGRYDFLREGIVLEKDLVYSGERCGQNGSELFIFQGGGEF